MKKLIHYILIAIMLNWNVAVLAEGDEGCKWEIVEETERYLQEQCVGGDGYAARIRSKDINGEVNDIKIVEIKNEIEKIREQVQNIL